MIWLESDGVGSRASYVIGLGKRTWLSQCGSEFLAQKIGKLAFIKSWADYHTGWGQGSVATDGLVTVFVYSVSHMKDLSPSHNFLETRNFLEVLVQIVSWESTVIATQELPPGRCITLNDRRKGGCDYTENYLWEHNSSYFLKNIFNVLLFLNLNFTWIHCSKVEIK